MRLGTEVHLPAAAKAAPAPSAHVTVAVNVIRVRAWRLGALIFLGLVVACVASPTRTGAVPTTVSPEPTISDTPRAAGETSTASSARLVTAPTLNGRQAVYRGAEIGFVAYPSGTFAADPGANFDNVDAVTVTRGLPKLRGSGGVTYDAMSKRWLPVWAWQLSPDGLSYAYVELILAPAPAQPGPRGWIRNEIHVVEIASAADRIVWTGGPGDQYRVAAFRPEGIYLTKGCNAGCSPDIGRLWRFDTATAQVTTVTSIQADWVITGEYAYGFEGDPTALSTLNGPLLRVDLINGTVTQVMSSGPRANVQAIGPDGTIYAELLDPEAGSGGRWLFAVDSQGRRQGIAVVPTGYLGIRRPVADGEGLWFADGRGLWLYRTGSGVSLMSHETVVMPAGPLLHA